MFLLWERSIAGVGESTRSCGDVRSVGHGVRNVGRRKKERHETTTYYWSDLNKWLEVVSHRWSNLVNRGTCRRSVEKDSKTALSLSFPEEYVDQRDM